MQRHGLEAMQEPLRELKCENDANATSSCTINPSDAQFDLSRSWAEIADEKRAAGYGLSESGRHCHVLLASQAALDSVSIAKTWRMYAGSGNKQDSAKVDLY